MTVVECLEDSDETLKRRTMDLLFKMTNPNNVEIVVERLLAHLGTAPDMSFKEELVKKICLLAEQFAPSNVWYLEAINMVYLECGSAADDVVDSDIGNNIIRLVAETDPTEGTPGEADLRVVAANGYIRLLEKYVSDSDLSFSSKFLKIIIWMVGEFATLATLSGYTVDDIVDLLIDGMRKDQSRIIMGYFVTALAKVGLFASPV